MLQGFFAAFSEVSQCYLVVAVALIGTWVYLNKKTWCDASLGKLLKGKCDRTKQILFAGLLSFVVLVLIRNVMPGSGMSGYPGGGYSGMYP
jgi:hypothetical protein